jgi:hypothetical protein
MVTQEYEGELKGLKERSAWFLFSHIKYPGTEAGPLQRNSYFYVRKRIIKIPYGKNNIR